jgi:hypothetical protein
MQYLLGLRALGHDVWYLEDCGDESWVYDWHEERLTNDLVYPTRYIDSCLTAIGFGQRWIYRTSEDSVGMPTEQFMELCSSADLLLLRAVPMTRWRSEYHAPRRRAFVDVDPGFTQFKIANGVAPYVETIEHCEQVFSISPRIGAGDCSIPSVGRRWISTVSPIYLPAWPVADAVSTTFTTVMQWQSYRDEVFEGVEYGSKSREFARLLSLPRRTTQPLEIALTGGDPEVFLSHGWQVVEGWSTSFTPESYQGYIQRSRAELSVAKHGYVATRGGWFSDRSVCYLASGRPVLIQDTGLDAWLPTGQGVVTFRDEDEALGGIDRINADYAEHSRMARALAEGFFSADSVLTALLEEAMA